MLSVIVFEIVAQAYLVLTYKSLRNKILDYTIVIFPHKKPQANKKTFIGFEFTIIDERITKLDKKIENLEKNNVLILPGGGDLKKIGVEMAENLLKNFFNPHLVLGPTNETKIKNNNYKVSRNISNISHAIKNANWMITNGGGALFEAMCSGRPAYAMPTTKEEQRIVNFLLEKQALIDVSLNQVKNIKNEKWIKIKKNSTKIVDGKGLERICNIIQDKYHNKN